MRLSQRLKGQEGVTLVLAILILATLTLTGTSLIYYSSTNARSSYVSKSGQTAYSLAEAGIGQALSVLNNAVNPLTSTLLSTPTTVTLVGGTATFSGTLNGEVWTITSTGTVANPTGASAITRTLTRSAQVYGLNSGASVSAWSRWFADSTNCLTIEDVTIDMPIATRGGLCLKNAASVTGAGTTLEVGGNVTITRTTQSSLRDPTAATGWTNSTNVFTSNNSYGTASVAASTQSANLDVTGFGFSIPSTATILGIQVDVERAASATSAISDYDVFVLKGGSSTGITDHAAGGTWVTSDSNRAYGNAGDLWGTTWTPANINASNFGLRFKVQNTSASTRTASVDDVDITVYYQPVPTGTIGTAGTPLSAAHIVGTCKFDTQAAHTPCTSVDKVWATTIDSAPQNMTKPTIDMQYWYDNAKPGPKNNCTTGSFPNSFDNDTVYNNSVNTAAEITPTNSSYTCQVKDANGSILGEISWNHVTHVLTIKGTIFVDGDFRFDDDGQVVHYQGRGIIYAAGDIEFDELVCAGGSGTSSCVTTGMANWDPTTNMMIVLAGGNAEYDQGSTQAQGVPSGLQGLIYAKGDCTVHENFHTSGPIVCDNILLPSAANGWPTYYSWPPLGSLIAGQMYGNPNGASDFAVVPGNQSG
jgi:Tfp pilus assembly protein PilX